MEKIYLDYAASTPVAPEVVKAMKPYWSDHFGNPGSLHSFGQKAMAAIDYSREVVAKNIGAQFREIIFTASATEANNLALRGVLKLWQQLEEGRGGKRRPRLIISSIEHESVLETARDLEKEGVEVIILPVDLRGVVSLKDVEAALDERTVLASIMYGNNEVGSIQPIQKIGETIKKLREKTSSPFPLFHTDASQVFSYLSVDVKELGVDLATFSGHKMYSPKGVGVLYARVLTEERVLQPMITGGSQEFGFRSGTENVPLIVGFGEAMTLALKNREKETKRISSLKKYFFERVKRIDSKVIVNGPRLKDGLPHILNLSLSRVLAADLLVYLDLHGIAVSTGSACTARSPRPSHVLQALGVSQDQVLRSIRFSFGRDTTKNQLDKVTRCLQNGFYKNKNH